MTDPSSGQIAGLYRFPVKGLSPQSLQRATLGPNECLAFDRAYAIENGPGRFDPDDPKPLPKINFLMLMRDERLAALETQFDDETQTLTILRGGKQVARGNLTMPIGRKMIEQFVAAYMADELRGPPKIVHAQGHSFSDVAAKCLHIVNLASLRELERFVGKPLDPLRFRANVYIEGLTPWDEFSWLDKEITIGGATATVFARTQRCAATDVDPTTAKRDTSIPSVLQRTFGHSDFGVYATVKTAGDIAVGDSVCVA